MLKIIGPNPNEVTHKNIMDFLSIRKTWFVDNLGWQLLHTENAEWDEYDLPHAQFVVAYQDGHCVGGARLMRTDAITPLANGAWASFMLEDFLSGRIETGLQRSDLVRNVPADPNTWELTRFVSSSPSVTASILDTINTYLSKIGAENVVTISPRLMPAVLRKLGYKAHRLSKPIVFDGKEYVVLKTAVKNPATMPV